ncbi:MAG: hypothetical protein FJY91_02570 [Candidatus Harrisonbacteria bacterium]|nr:hypothetical protein [Candidatus Harrisonbacteria bacterium]
MKRVRNHKQRNAVRKMYRSHRAAQKKQVQLIREFAEKEFWLDDEDWNARVEACIIPELQQDAETEDRSL